MKTEEYIKKIVEETGIGRKEIQELIEEKKKELEGLISEEGALFIISKELGVNLNDEEKDFINDIEINISKLTQNMKNITLIGRVQDVYNIRNFSKKDGTQGFVGSFKLFDGTGEVRVVLWDDKTGYLNSLNMNTLVKVINGYVKMGINQQLEVHLGRFGKILTDPTDVDYKKYPKKEIHVLKINEIQSKQQGLTIEGKILHISDIKEFKKNDNTGKLCSIRIKDTTGSIRVTFWNSDVEKLNLFNVGDFVSISNLYSKESQFLINQLELHARISTKITKLSEKLEIQDDSFQKISDLQNTQGVVSFKGIITSIENLKEISLKTGEAVSLLGFNVSDDTDSIRVTLWRDSAEEYSKRLKNGISVSLKDVSVRFSSFSQRNEVNFLQSSNLEVIDDLKLNNIIYNQVAEKAKIKEVHGRVTKIAEIQNQEVIEINGFIVKQIEDRNVILYEACSKCFKKVDNCSCEETHEIIHRLILNVLIDDGTGTIRTTFFGVQAERLLGFSTSQIKDVKYSPDFESFLENCSSQLIGRDLVITGRTLLNQFNNQNRYDLNVIDFKELNYSSELKNIMERI